MYVNNKEIMHFLKPPLTFYCSMIQNGTHAEAFNVIAVIIILSSLAVGVSVLSAGYDIFMFHLICEKTNRSYGHVHSWKSDIKPFVSSADLQNNYPFPAKPIRIVLIAIGTEMNFTLSAVTSGQVDDF